jgi:fucose permease
MNENYKGTVISCYLGLVTQAIVNTLVPILFIVFQNEFQISYEQLGRLILLNFITQLVVDYIIVKVVEKIGYRKLTVIAHLFSTMGLIFLAWLPNILEVPYHGMLIAVITYAIGGGLIEVLVSPIVESVPGEDKAGAMSLLHSFYSWGQLAVVVITTIGLRVIGRDKWYYLVLVWALIPLINMFRFMKVPLMPVVPEDGSMSLKKLFKNKGFILIIIIMVCGAASEQIIAQWSSLFAEKGLKVSKTLGDIFGIGMFALFMGIGRTLYGIYGSKIKLNKVLLYASILCAACYLTIVFSTIPAVSLLAFGICGLAVSVMWPGVISLSAKKFPMGGAGMFGILAIFGDLGCSFGPWTSGLISSAAMNFTAISIAEDNALKLGIGFGIIFPITMILGLLFMKS